MENDVTKELQRCLYEIIKTSPFIGSLLQEMTFKFDNHTVPTAGVTFNNKTAKFELLVNTDFFMGKAKDPDGNPIITDSKQRTAILTHEILHFLHNHLFRFQQMEVKGENRMFWNIAADMAINQYIPNLPKGCIKVEDFKTADKKPFPKLKSMEEYYDLIQKNREGDKTKGEDLVDQKGNPKNDSHGNQMVDKNGNPYQNPDGSAMQGTGNEGSNKDILDKYQPFDEHDWDGLSEEEKERMIREMKNVLQRTIEKTSYSHSTVPGSVADLIKEIDAHLQKFNYKAILKQAIKKTALAQDRESSWKRTSKRYEEKAPGTTVSRMPKLNMYVDTSGSISYKELNAFLDIIDGFLKQGTKTCSLALWHTEIYYNKKYRLKTRLKEKEIKGGGTDPDPVLDLIGKDRPELSIILTDGYYSPYRGRMNKLKGLDVIWIISENGDTNHPNKSIGKTIPMRGIK